MSRLPVRTDRDPLSPWTRAILALVQGLLPAMTAIIGGLWISFTYLEQQRQAQADANDRAKREAKAQFVQARLPFLEKQLALYFEAAQVAGKLSVYTTNENDWSDAERHFWLLYFGEVSMVEDGQVLDAMNTFAIRLREYTDAVRRNVGDPEPKKDSVRSAASDLTQAIHKSIVDAWFPEPPVVRPAQITRKGP
jgi:hypothetical protein